MTYKRKEEKTHPDLRLLKTFPAAANTGDIAPDICDPAALTSTTSGLRSSGWGEGVSPGFAESNATSLYPASVRSECIFSLVSGVFAASSFPPVNKLKNLFPTPTTPFPTAWAPEAAYPATAREPDDAEAATDCTVAEKSSGYVVESWNLRIEII